MSALRPKGTDEMDQATRRARAKAKQQARKNADGLAIGQIAPRGMGRKAKPSEVFQPRQCDYRIGGKEKLIRRKRNNPSPGQAEFYFIPLIVGGQRCLKNELASGRCLEHLGATYAEDE